MEEHHHRLSSQHDIAIVDRMDGQVEEAIELEHVAIRAKRGQGRGILIDWYLSTYSQWYLR